ncbi:hypothetical protein SDJN02_04898, partial [Cucurbita argyrosperma subsp. argyrosperma]
MAEIQSHQPGQHGSQPRYQVVKAATAATAGGSLLVLSGLILAGTVIALTIATPLLVIFSPVLVPAVITVSLLILGFLASEIDLARHKLATKAREMKDRAEQFGQQQTSGPQTS